MNWKDLGFLTNPKLAKLYYHHFIGKSVCPAWRRAEEMVSVSRSWNKSFPIIFLHVFKEFLVWVLVLVTSWWVLGGFPELSFSKSVLIAAAILALSAVVRKMSRPKSPVVYSDGVVEVLRCPLPDLRTDSFSGSECINPSASEDSEAESEWTSREDGDGGGGGRGRDWSDDGSITDEESLIEIAIPSGHYIGCGKKEISEIGDVNEEENLIEIDISMGSIKCVQGMNQRS